MRSCRTALPLLVLAVTLVLHAGRPVFAQSTTSATVSQLTVKVLSGPLPIAGAKVQIYQADLTSDTPASTPLLSYPAYTDGNGVVNISGVSCDPSGLYYLTAINGDAGSGANSVVAEITAVGSCNALASLSTVVLNEVTTVASTYALSGFMTALPSVGAKATPTAGAGANDAVLAGYALTGITNAFATTGNLVDIRTGLARTTTLPGNGTVPQSEINTLANALAACVQSTGFGSSACTGIIANTPSRSGIAPLETVQAALNIAHNPSANVAALYNLAIASNSIGGGPCKKPPTCTFARATSSLYAPTLASSPNDWSIVVAYTGGAVYNPTGLAIDSDGSAWVANNTINATSHAASVSKFANNGAVLSGTGYTAPYFSFADGIAIDLTGNAWVPAYGSENVVVFASNGYVLSNTAGYTSSLFTSPRGIAFDTSANALIPSDGSDKISTITKFDGYGHILSGSSGYSIPNSTAPYAIAVDQKGAAWIANIDDGNVAKLDAQGNVLSGSTGFTGGGLSADPASVAIDASGNAWVDNLFTGKLTELNSAGAILSGPTGFPTCVPLATDPTFQCNGGVAPISSYVAIDGASNIWVPLSYSVTVFQPTRAVTIPHYGLAELNDSGAIISGPTGYANDTTDLVSQIAIDNSGNVWCTTSRGVLRELIGAAVPVTTPLSAALRTGTLASRP